jgi:cysteine desulfurase
MPQTIYADYNATTPLCAGAKERMMKALEIWGNPSSAHHLGRAATQLLEESRRQVAEAAGVSPEEVAFTSGGAEANTLCLLGSRYLAKDFRLVTTGLEHSSIKGACEFLTGTGAEVRKLKAKRDGSLDLDGLEKLLSEFKPHLVSVMAANNETGVLFPVSEVARICASAGVVFHTDAVQAFGKVSPTHWNGADLISISAHKVGGPKGAGALIVRRGRQLVCTHFGGSQELKRRGGTQNMVGIAGFAGACAELPSPERLAQVAKLRDGFETKLKGALSGVHFQGSALPRVPTTSNLRTEGVRGEVLLGALDLDGICVSAGSACSSGSLTPSHVLTEMGLTESEAKECLRFSFSWVSPPGDIDTVANAVIHHVNRIRARNLSR